MPSYLDDCCLLLAGCALLAALLIPESIKEAHPELAADYVVPPSAQAFTFFCNGSSHSSSGTPLYFPHYSSYRGLIER